MDCIQVADELHQLCIGNSRPSLDRIRELVEGQPDVLSLLSTKDKFGDSFLYNACFFGKPLEVIVYFLSIWPTELASLEEQRSILLAACRPDNPIQPNLDTVRSIAEKWPAACLQQDKTGKNLLHIIAQQGIKGELTRLKDQLKEASLSRKKLFYEAVALHIASLLDVLVKPCPEAARLSDSKGDLPLHTLCWQHENTPIDFDLTSIVAVLVRAWPESVTRENNDGMVPLEVLASADQTKPRSMEGDPDTEDLPPKILPGHRLIDSLCPPEYQGESGDNLRFMRKLRCSLLSNYLIEHPDAQDKSTGDTCLHIACQDSLPILHELVNLSKEWEWEETIHEAARIRNKEGELPLHCACEGSDTWDRDVAAVRDLFPEAVQTPLEVRSSDSGKIMSEWPLHMLLRHHPTMTRTIIQFASQYHDAVGKPDRHGVYPFMRAAAAEDASLDVLFRLVQLNPQLLVASTRWDQLHRLGTAKTKPQLRRLDENASTIQRPISESNSKRRRRLKRKTQTKSSTTSGGDGCLDESGTDSESCPEFDSPRELDPIENKPHQINNTSNEGCEKLPRKKAKVQTAPHIARVAGTNPFANSDSD